MIVEFLSNGGVGARDYILVSLVRLPTQVVTWTGLRCAVIRLELVRAMDDLALGQRLYVHSGYAGTSGQRPEKPREVVARTGSRRGQADVLGAWQMSRISDSWVTRLDGASVRQWSRSWRRPGRIALTCDSARAAKDKMAIYGGVRPTLTFMA